MTSVWLLNKKKENVFGNEWLTRRSYDLELAGSNVILGNPRWWLQCIT